MDLKNIKLIVGLGNVGDKYKNTRHNAGFILVDNIHDKYNGSDWKTKFKGEISDVKIDGNKIYLLKPSTYMNLSGESVCEAVKFFKIKIEEVLVVHDEIDLEFGQIKIKQGGGNAGHNGLKSISQICGNDYFRYRVGVGHPRDIIPGMEVADYVLSKFSLEELKEIKQLTF